MARLLQAHVKTDLQAIWERVTVGNLRIAKQLIYQVGGEETDDFMATKQGRKMLTGLDPYWSKGKDGLPGGWVTKGRLRKGIFNILGVYELPIILKTSRLAYVLMLKAHQEDHKAAKSTLWRLRTKAWILKGKSLAIQVERSRERERDREIEKKLCQQQMGDLPEVRVNVGSPPFYCICLDFLGPMEIKAMMNRRAHMKVWPLLLVC